MRLNRSLPRPSTRDRNRRPAIEGLLAALLFAAAAEASQECPNGGNLIPNCGFEVNDTTFWEPFNGVLATSTSFAHTGLASGVIGAEEGSPGQFGNGIEACIEDVPPSTEFEYGVWALFTTKGSLTGVGCVVSIAEYDADGCTGFTFNESNGSGGAGLEIFEEVRGQKGFTTGASPGSIGIGVGCGIGDAAEDFELYLDDFFLIPALTVFKNGFESGNNCDWSDRVGGGCPP